MAPALIFCADGSPAFARAAVEAGWLYGARLPATVYAPVYFADQDWRSPARGAYMAALAAHRPALATVLDWEDARRLGEVVGWAVEAAPLVTGAVVIVPKVVDGVRDVPVSAGGRPIVLGYSVPTFYGACPVPTWEFAGRPVHLLGGSPQEQLRLRGYLDVRSLDGNMAGMQARRGRFWARRTGPKGHWRQARQAGLESPRPALECFRRSLDAIWEAWAVG